jgi:SAM-dependent methyltransferase
MKDAHRTLEQIKEHYEIETKLAKKLRNSAPEERLRLYSSVYEELFRLLPHHPRSVIALSDNDTASKVSFQMRNICRFLKETSVFLEIGAGDCALASEVAKLVNKVYALDITEANVRKAMPGNLQFVLSGGCSIPIEENSVNVAYSYQMMEHLHPDDALDQLENIYRVLAPGGIYICDTPNRLSGPHDISRHFDRVATGFHLKEYTITELSNLFRMVGFSKARIHIRITQFHAFLPTLPGVLCEMALEKLPYALRKKLSSIWPISLLLGIRLIATK